MTLHLSDHCKASRLPLLGRGLLVFFFCLMAFPVLTLAEDSHTPLESIACPGERTEGEKADCFILHLPADWTQLSGRSIEVPVMRYAALGGQATKPPLLMLVGGPGQSAIYFEKGIARNLKIYRQDRDLILMDQRGTGPFAKDIDCQNARDEKERIKVKALIECVQTAREAGYGYGDYSSAWAAKDYRALRYALQIDRWSVIATSYGARIAQRLLEIDAKGIDRVLFNGPLFNQTLFFDWDPFSVIQDAVEQCEERDACREAYPNLHWDFTALPFSMQKVELKEGEAPSALQPYLYRRRLQAMLHRHQLPKLPEDITETYKSVQAALKDSAIWTPPPPLPQSMKRIGLMMHFSIMCAEEIDRMKDQDLNDLKQPLQVNFYRHACEELNKAKALPQKMTQGWDKGKKSTKPILVFNGAFDTLVNPASLKNVLPLYPKARHIELPFAGHDVLTRNACAREIAEEFLNGGSPAKLDVSCIEKEVPAFELPNAQQPNSRVN